MKLQVAMRNRESHYLGKYDGSYLNSIVKS